MMRRSTLVTTALLLAMSVLTPLHALHAQIRPFRIGVGGGPAMPLGESGDQLILGWNALGMIAIAVPALPLGLRLDAAYNEFGFERALLGSSGGPPGSQRVTSFTVNPTLNLPTEGQLVTPYFIGGVGSYSVGCTESSSVCTSSTHVGWNVGGGAKFQLFGLRAFAEARYHRTSQRDLSVQYLPLTLGLLF
jgi:hypothetical protein